MSTRSISWVKGGRCVRLTNVPPSCAVVTKSGNLNFLEPFGPVQACNGTALSLPLIIIIIICRHIGVKKMADKRGFARRNRGLFNSNTGPSHTKKKLQEIYFEAARHRLAMQKMWKRIGDNPTHYCSV